MLVRGAAADSIHLRRCCSGDIPVRIQTNSPGLLQRSPFIRPAFAENSWGAPSPSDVIACVRFHQVWGWAA